MQEWARLVTNIGHGAHVMCAFGGKTATTQCRLHLSDENCFVVGATVHIFVIPDIVLANISNEVSAILSLS